MQFFKGLVNLLVLLELFSDIFSTTSPFSISWLVKSLLWPILFFNTLCQVFNYYQASTLLGYVLCCWSSLCLVFVTGLQPPVFLGTMKRQLWKPGVNGFLTSSMALFANSFENCSSRAALHLGLRESEATWGQEESHGLDWNFRE